MPRKIRPTGDRVLIRMDPMAKTIAGGALHCPDTAQSRPKWGTVVAAGKGRYTRKNRLIEMPLSVGDRVCIEWRTGHEIVIAGCEHVMARLDDILAVDDDKL